jgi:excisionase family DNA binding protein
MEQYLTAADVATMLQVHMETVLRWARTGELAGAKLGKLWRFRRADVDAFVQRQQPAHADALSIPL